MFLCSVALCIALLFSSANIFPAESVVSQRCQPIESVAAACPSKNKTLHLVVMAPFPDATPGLAPGWKGGPAVVPSTLLAIEHINSRCDILESYYLKVVVADSGCDVSSKAVINALCNLFYSDVRVIGIIGPGCSEATIAVGKLMAHKNISLIHIAPSATSPVLVNNTVFPNTFRPIGSSLSFVNVHSEFIILRNYTNVGILFETEREYHKATSSAFRKRLEQMKVSVASFGMMDSFIPLSDLRNRHRIIFVFAGGEMARKLMCLAYHNNMIYPIYQFIFIERRLGHFVQNISFTLDDTFECSSHVMERAIAGIILNLVQLTRTDTSTTLENGMNYISFNESYTKALEAYKTELGLKTVVDTEHQSGYYDSTWALALSFNAAIPHLESRLNGSLSDYKYGRPAFTEVIRNELLNISFEGVRGEVRFSNDTLDAAEVTVLNMYQVQLDGKTVLEVGSYNPVRSQGDQLQIFNSSLFIPDDFTDLMQIISPPLFVEVLVFIALGIAMVSTICFHVMNILWVGAKSMKATSTHLNHIIFSGCYLYVLSIVFKSFQAETGLHKEILFGVRCSAFIWCESIALTLIFGTISVKLWRVYRIFSHTSADVLSSLHDYRLVLYVSALLVVDIVFNVAWNVINPWFKQVGAEDDQLRIRQVCNCENLIAWLGCFLALKVLLGFVALYLSILTRRIPRQEYKQTKSVNALIYSLLFIYCLTIPIHLILLSKTSVILVTVSYVALCFKNLVCIILCTVFIFLPPVMPILKQKWHTMTLSMVT